MQWGGLALQFLLLQPASLDQGSYGQAHLNWAGPACFVGVVSWYLAQ